MTLRRSAVAATIALTSIAAGACGGVRAPSAAAPSDAAAATPSPSAPAAAIESAAPSASTAPPAPPEVSGEEIQPLVVEGFEPSAIAIPLGATTPRPIVVATHGNFDRPEWQCEIWSQVFRRKAFVLCPRGRLAAGSTPTDQRFTYSDHVSLEREIDAGLAALRASAFSAWLADGPPVYAGFSLGSIMGVTLATRRAKDFPTMVLVEGGLDKMTDNLLLKFVRDGGRRMMLVCAQGGCAGPAKLLADRVTHHGGLGVVVDAGNVGHRYDGPVADAVSAALPAFLSEDPAWAGLLE